MINRVQETSPAQPSERLKKPIADVQMRTRDRVFKTAGNAVELTLDTGEFIVESGAYATGRTVLATGKGFKALIQGILGKRHPRT